MKYLDVKVYADDEPLKVNAIQQIELFTGDVKYPMKGYLLQVDKPKNQPTKPYIIFRVEAENKEFNEKG